ncbi:MAG TPA: glycine--tRNA ligase subunit beta, partial [bacterium]|nr:glycine--tRNA ligase subunit beta [bacterium]
MLDILIEIGVEELPISEGEKIINDFGAAMREFLEENNLRYQMCAATGSPRRIVLIIKELLEKQADSELKIYGPPKNVFFDAANQITKAGEKFLEKNNKKISDVIFSKKPEANNDIEYALIIEKKAGENAIDLLAKNIEDILLSLNIKKKMRWTDENLMFSRPIRWICALANNEKLNLKIADVVADNKTYGHRFLSPNAIEIKSIDDYFDQLKKNHVIADKFSRKKIMLTKIEKLIENTNLSVELDEELIDINNFLVEYPNPIICEFPKDFLKIPEETLISTMKKHQKYFAMYDKTSGKLTNKFVVISNMTDKFINNIKRGNERVITARFEDAKFYYEDDLKKDLVYFNDKLKKITYIDGIGSIYKKIERMKKIVEYISTKFCVSETDKTKALQSTELCKFDLATGMVYEFPQLQGMIGAHYAKKKGIDDVVANSIKTHYLPAGNLSELPDSVCAKLTALADKFDIMSVCYLLSLKPSGSADPYAVRRAVRGTIAIIRSFQINIDLIEILKYSLSLAYQDLENKKNIAIENVLNELLEFYKNRFVNLLEEEGKNINFIRMAVDAQTDKFDILAIDKKLTALLNLQNDENLQKVLQAFKRLNNILKKLDSLKKVDISLFQDNIEKELYDKFLEIKKEVEEFVIKNNYEKIIIKLSMLGPIIDRYFDSVLVMAKDEKIKNNRLAMLKEISDYYKKQY